MDKTVKIKVNYKTQAIKEKKGMLGRFQEVKLMEINLIRILSHKIDLMRAGLNKKIENDEVTELRCILFKNMNRMH